MAVGPYLARALPAALLACLVPLAGSFLGALHPLGDSLAVFRAPLAGLTLALAALAGLAGSRRAGALAGGCAVAALLSLVPYLLRPGLPKDVGLVLYQKNINFRLADPEPLVAEIKALAPDIVTLQEVQGPAGRIIDRLRTGFETRVVCPFSAVGGPAILARHPALPGSEACHDGAAEVTLDTPCGQLRVISVHLHWPWPYGQGVQVDGLLPALAGDPGGPPTLVAGDFNMVQWSHAIRAIGRATGTGPLNASRVTLPDKIFGAGFPIDHVLAPTRKGMVRLRPALGSDHLGIEAHLPCP